MKVLMIPHKEDIGDSPSGINTVVRKYFKYMPGMGIELVPRLSDNFDILHIHAGASNNYPRNATIVSSLHGLYWTADYEAPSWEKRMNANVVRATVAATKVTVPSAWVGETLRRDMHLVPDVVPHGVDWDEWQHDGQKGGYVIAYAKNRAWADVSVPVMATKMARQTPGVRFVATYAQDPVPQNMRVTGSMPYNEMKRLVQRSSVFVSPVKETFGIAALEAMAAGVPVLTVDAGGVPTFVDHGVTGYCYQDGNLDDMLQGLAYCLENERVLGANAREVARQFTWEKAAQKMVDVYESAVGTHTMDISVVIPVYNKEVSQVERAISSAKNQTRPAERIIVVDDGSDNGREVERAARENGVEYVRQENQGVAVARNNGIARTDTEYIVCLDADDKIEPRFLEFCADALDSDRSLYVAYTKLRYIKPDGETGVSQWPDGYNFDKFLERGNQVPTCCMFRRVVWERLGGYRQRYAPSGAGAEDAEFFLRAGAYGYRGELVHEDPSFVYSEGSGHTAQGDYREVDWLAWHKPWLEGKHPFASAATPEEFSHPVRQYDEPIISVVIPVGPGHENALWNALDSLEAQTFLKWEAIVVLDGVRFGGEREEGEFWPSEAKRMFKAYPFVKWFTIAPDPVGAGAARNFGAEQAQAPLLLFLDADDWLYPEFMEQAMAAWVREKNAVYTDYVGIVDNANLDLLADDLKSSVLDYDEETGNAVIEYSAMKFDCQKAIKQPEFDQDPYVWCNITTLFPRRWHEDIGGFDESLESWEDVDYWWRMARAGRCFTRITEPLMVYRFSTGSRRDQGLRKRHELLEYLNNKREEEGTSMGCGCSGSKTVDPVSHRMQNMVSSTQNGSSQQMNDNEVVMVEYMHPNKGQHSVRGTATKRFYGYRSGGDRFLVHVDDIQERPHLFRPVEGKADELGVQAREARGVPDKPEPVAANVDAPDEDLVQAPATKEGTTEEEIQAILEEASGEPLDLANVSGIRKDAIQELARHGVTTKKRALDLGVEGLQKIKWIGESTAEEIIKEASS